MRKEAKSMAVNLRFTQLSPARRALVRLCQETNYGLIERLHVRDCQPVNDPPPLVLSDLKLDRDEELRPEFDLTDFVLRNEFCRLMNRLDELRNGIVERVEVHAGVPRRILLHVSAASIKFAPPPVAIVAAVFQGISGGMPDVKEEHVETV